MPCGLRICIPEQDDSGLRGARENEVRRLVGEVRVMDRARSRRVARKRHRCRRVGQNGSPIARVAGIRPATLNTGADLRRKIEASSQVSIQSRSPLGPSMNSSRDTCRAAITIRELGWDIQASCNPRVEICWTAQALPSGSLKKTNPTLSRGSGTGRGFSPKTWISLTSTPLRAPDRPRRRASTPRRPPPHRAP